MTKRTTEQRKSNLFFFKVISKEGKIVQTGSSKNYTNVLVEATDYAKEHNGYWQILSRYGRVVEDNLPSTLEVK